MRIPGLKKKGSKVLIANDSDLKLKVKVIKASSLQVSDKIPVVSPYVVLRANHYRYSTHPAVGYENSPEWNTNFEVPLSGYSGKSGLTIKVWDKEGARKMYIGEVSFTFQDLFPGNKCLRTDDPDNEPKWYTIKSARADNEGKAAGEIHLHFSIDSAKSNEDLALQWKQLVAALESLPASTTARSRQLISGDEGGSSNDDDNGITSGEESDIEDEGQDEEDEETISDEPEEAPKIQVTAAPGKAIKAPEEQVQKKKGISRATRKKSSKHYEFNTKSNVVGVAFLDVVSVSDLPPMRNMTRTGFDMDPFVVVSFGKKTFRTPYRRHTLNPVFNEKLLFPVQKHEQNFSINFTVMDKDRITSNDFVADCDLSVQDLIELAPVPNQDSGLYEQADFSKEPPPTTVSQRPQKRRSVALRKIKSWTSLRSSSRRNTPVPTPTHTAVVTPADSEASLSSAEQSDSNSNGDGGSRPLRITPSNGRHPHVPHNGLNGLTSDVADNRVSFDGIGHKEFRLPMKLKQKSKWEDKHNPELVLRGRFLPYAALRQHFWRGLIRTYDSDDTETISYIELTTMLESLGSTLTRTTIEGYFTRFGRSIDGELTLDETIICLEDQVIKDTIQQSRSSGGAAAQDDLTSCDDSDVLGKSYDSDVSSSLKSLDGNASSNSLDSVGDIEGRVVERVIQIGTCPVCNQPRLGKRTEIDIVTHLATCATQNWAQVDTLVMDRYVTSNQARKRWYSKIVSKVSYGNYKLGANSANILVQDRVTGYVLEEKMSAYVRLGIRLLYKGVKSSQRMEVKRVRALLRSMSVKQGKKYDSPQSVHNIVPFIKFHNLYMEDVLEPVKNFKNFNQFFYRKLKPGARVCDAPDNAKIAVSPADCRTTMFETVQKATEIWIKGREFSIKRLLGDAYPDMVDKFTDGALAVFRLAPQDYHRFHIPVNGVLGKPKEISGEYYTVNPMAIRSALDVYGENVRVLVPIESEEFGTVMVVCVGAMMVGSTVITAKEGDQVKRLDELGYFQFGGSTLVVLFEPGKIVFDEDLVSNSNDALETLVRVGMSIGHTVDEKEWERNDPKSPELASEEQKKMAQRMIPGGGSGGGEAEGVPSIDMLQDY